MLSAITVFCLSFVVGVLIVWCRNLQSRLDDYYDMILNLEAKVRELGPIETWRDKDMALGPLKQMYPDA